MLNFKLFNRNIDKANTFLVNIPNLNIGVVNDKNDFFVIISIAIIVYMTLKAALRSITLYSNKVRNTILNERSDKHETLLEPRRNLMLIVTDDT